MNDCCQRTDFGLLVIELIIIIIIIIIIIGVLGYHDGNGRDFGGKS